MSLIYKINDILHNHCYSCYSFTHLVVSKLWESVHDDTKDDVETDGGDDDEEWQVKHSFPNMPLKRLPFRRGQKLKYNRKSFLYMSKEFNCIYIYIYICMYVCICNIIYNCIYMYICICSCICNCICILGWIVYLI